MDPDLNPIRQRFALARANAVLEPMLGWTRHLCDDDFWSYARAVLAERGLALALERSAGNDREESPAWIC